MGCDIHLHQEVKINGEWQHYSAPDMNRDYLLFAKMGDVRNYQEVIPLSRNRGIPDDATAMTKFAFQLWREDWHSESWLNAEEIAALEVWAHGMELCEVWEFERIFWGYFFGSTWGSFHRYPNERPPGVEDVRFIFWFDN